MAANKSQQASKAPAAESKGAASNSAAPAKDAGTAQDVQSAPATIETPPVDKGKAQGVQTKSKRVPALFVRSRPSTGFRRCGFAFTPDGFGIALNCLSDNQIETLMTERNLVVEEVDIDPDQCVVVD